MAVIYNEYYNPGNSLKYSAIRNKPTYKERYLPRSPTDLKKRVESSSARTLNHSQRVGVVYVLLIFFFLIILGLFLGGNAVLFEDVRFDTFNSYNAFNPILPRVETVLEEFSSVNGIISLREFMNLEVITGDWGIFEGIRSGINLISRPFVFIGSLIDNLFSTIAAFLNAFIV